MKEYRQPKHSLKKQISLLLPFEIYDGAKRDAQKYGRSMAYHIVETLRLTYDKSIKEVQAEKEAAAKVRILQEMTNEALENGESEEFCSTLESVFGTFSEVKKAEDFTAEFRNDVVMFAKMMLESKSAEG
ncbi:MAG: hypothetical protein OXN17_19915 [Candidatus Poribacteria bacterium]|nr:hypothetical protein [Candidatus Poribacteria bacterium]MDE0506138.1 hypothetical protein [Candidatus Poribacteria bacterium]